MHEGVFAMNQITIEITNTTLHKLNQILNVINTEEELEENYNPEYKTNIDRLISALISREHERYDFSS